MKNFSLLAVTAGFLAVALSSFTPRQHLQQDALPLLPATALSSNGLVSLSANLNAEYYLYKTDPNTAYLYVEVKTDEYENEDLERAPLNLSLVIDRSGSMSGEKLQYAKQAATFVVEQLEPSDRVSVVSYDNNVRTDWGSSAVKHKKAITQKIDYIVAGGSTNLSGGLEDGYKEVKSTYGGHFTNRVLLLSDGLANKGITDEDKLNKIASTWNQEKNITTSTFGLGSGFNENLMQSLAEYGSGNYYFIEKPSDVPQIFQRELNGLLSVVGQNATLSINLPDGLKLEKLYGYVHTQEGNEVKVLFKDLFANETKNLLLKLDISEVKTPKLVVSTKLDYDDATDGGKPISLKADAILNMTEDEILAKESVNKEVEQWVTFFASNDMLEEAMKLVDERRFDEADDILLKNEVLIKDRKIQYGENTQMIRQDSASVIYREKIKEVEVMSTAEYKTFQKASKSSNYVRRKSK